jgi:hypothetical protein
MLSRQRCKPCGSDKSGLEKGRSLRCSAATSTSQPRDCSCALPMSLGHPPIFLRRRSPVRAILIERDWARHVQARSPRAGLKFRDCRNRNSARYSWAGTRHSSPTSRISGV